VISTDVSSAGVWLVVWSRPGGPSAKTFHRAGSPNHQNDSKEDPMVERGSPVSRGELCGGVW
jgi:hypothetical protein